MFFCFSLPSAFSCSSRPTHSLLASLRRVFESWFEAYWSTSLSLALHKRCRGSLGFLYSGGLSRAHVTRGFPVSDCFCVVGRSPATCPPSGACCDSLQLSTCAPLAEPRSYAWGNHGDARPSLPREGAEAQRVTCPSHGHQDMEVAQQ